MQTKISLKGSLMKGKIGCGIFCRLNTDIGKIISLIFQIYADHSDNINLIKKISIMISIEIW